MEGGDDAEEVEDYQLEGSRSKGEEDQGPGQAQNQAKAQQGQHVWPFLGMWAHPYDLHHHGAQHGGVEQKHQAEEAQVGDVADQRVTDPAPVGKGTLLSVTRSPTAGWWDVLCESGFQGSCLNTAGSETPLALKHHRFRSTTDSETP